MQFIVTFIVSLPNLAKANRGHLHLFGLYGRRTKHWICLYFAVLFIQTLWVLLFGLYGRCTKHWICLYFAVLFIQTLWVLLFGLYGRWTKHWICLYFAVLFIQTLWVLLFGLYGRWTKHWICLYFAVLFIQTLCVLCYPVYIDPLLSCLYRPFGCFAVLFIQTLWVLLFGLYGRRTKHWISLNFAVLFIQTLCSLRLKLFWLSILFIPESCEHEFKYLQFYFSNFSAILGYLPDTKCLHEIFTFSCHADISVQESH